MNVEEEFGSVGTRDTYIEDIWYEDLLSKIGVPPYLLQ